MPPDQNELHQIIRTDTWLMTAHASDRAIERDISTADIRETVLSGEIIEDYPDDKYGPSCLILGKTKVGRVLHIHLSYPPKVKIITTYPPSPDKWESDWKTRKSNG